MNYLLVLLRHPPLIIHEEDRRAYYDALEAWDREQNLDVMKTFLREQTEKTWKKRVERDYYKSPVLSGRVNGRTCAHRHTDTRDANPYGPGRPLALTGSPCSQVGRQAGLRIRGRIAGVPKARSNPGFYAWQCLRQQA